MKRPNTHKNVVAKNDPWQTISDLDCYVDALEDVIRRLTEELLYINIMACTEDQIGIESAVEYAKEKCEVLIDRTNVTSIGGNLISKNVIYQTTIGWSAADGVHYPEKMTFSTREELFAKCSDYVMRTQTLTITKRDRWISNGEEPDQCGIEFVADAYSATPSQKVPNGLVRYVEEDVYRKYPSLNSIL